MRRPALRVAIVIAIVAGAFLAILFGLVNYSRGGSFLGFPYRSQKGVTCAGCGLGSEGVVAAVSIPKGTSASAISDSMVKGKEFPQGTRKLVIPRALRGEVAIRTIPVGAPLTADDFGLREPIYYPRGYPKNVPASDVPAKLKNSRYLPPQSFPSDFELAPGVWVDGASSWDDLDLHVANGTLVGYCGPIKAFEAHNPDIPFASKCWRH